MMPALRTNTRNNAHHLARLFADTAGACVLTQTLSATTTRKHFAAPHIAPAARPNRPPGALILARPKTLPTLRVTYTPKPAAKSP
jgi:hypothetical protein